MQLVEYLEKQAISRTEFAKKIGVSKGLISHYAAGRRKPSPSRALTIERETNGKVLKHELRPDIWTPPKRRSA